MGCVSLEEVLVLDELLDWQPSCEHSQHAEGRNGHSDESPLLSVTGKPMPCCGFISPVTFLCEWWWDDGRWVHCPECRSAVPSEDCYTVHGRV